MNMADLDLRHVIMNNNYERKLSGEVAMKKFISVALVAAMTASLAACGSSSEEEGSGDAAREHCPLSFQQWVHLIRRIMV